MDILFIGPRFHTNQFFSTKVLTEHGHNVNMLVYYKGKTENHSIIKPQVMKKSIFTHVSHFLITKFFNRESKTNLLNLFFAPSIFQVISILKSNYDLIIIRDRNLTALLFSVLSFFLGSGKNVFLYNQTPYENNLKGIIKIFSFLFPRKRITPIFSKSNIITKRNTYFVPFLVQENQKEKIYFLHNKINILTVGKYQPNKNFIYIIESVKELLNKDFCNLTIVGEVSNQHHEKYYKTIQNYIKSNNIKNIKLETNIPHSKIGNYYNANDIFILATKRELASISILEAQVNGLLVISTKNNGSNCYLFDELSYKIDVNNKSALNEIITNLSKNRKIISEKGQEAKEKFKNNYSVINYITAIEDLIND
jgi:glycosyltransferase involved in cell wall biosynthesis